MTATRPDEGSSPIPTRLPPEEFPPVVSAKAMQDMALPGTAGIPGFSDPPLPIDGSASLRTFVPPVVAAPRPGADDRPTLEEPIPLIRRNVGVLSPLIDETPPPEPMAGEAVLEGPASGYDVFGQCARCGGTDATSAAAAPESPRRPAACRTIRPMSKPVRRAADLFPPPATTSWPIFSSGIATTVRRSAATFPASISTTIPPAGAA